MTPHPHARGLALGAFGAIAAAGAYAEATRLPDQP